MNDFNNLFRVVKGTQSVIKELESSVADIKLRDDIETVVFKDENREDFVIIALLYWARSNKNNKMKMVIPDYDPLRELDIFKMYEVFVKNFDVSDECIFLKKAVVEKNLDSIIKLLLNNRYQIGEKVNGSGKLGNRIMPLGIEKFHF